MAEEQGQFATRFNISLTSFASLFVLARIYSCIHLLQRRLYLEEWLITISTILIWISIACTTAAFHWGFGRHLNTLTVEQMRTSSFWYTLGTAPGIFGVGLPKLSVVSLRKRVWLSTVFFPSQPKAVSFLRCRRFRYFHTSLVNTF